jgi:hypothetical protein
MPLSCATDATFGRLDAENFDALLVEILQKVTVVAGHLHHKGVWAKLPLRDHAHGIVTAMPQP